jgi:hypothetical protein
MILLRVVVATLALLNPNPVVGCLQANESEAKGAVTDDVTLDWVNQKTPTTAIEAATPGQGMIINSASTALNNGGISNEAGYLRSHIGDYGRLVPQSLNVPNPPPPGVYEVPK